MMDRPLDYQIFHNTNSLRCVPIASHDCWTANTTSPAEMTARAELLFTCIRSSHDPQELAITNDFPQVLYCNMCWQTTPRSASMFSVPFIDVYIPSHGSPPATTTLTRDFQTCLPDFCSMGDANVSPDPQSLFPPARASNPRPHPQTLEAKRIISHQFVGSPATIAKHTHQAQALKSGDDISVYLTNMHDQHTQLAQIPAQIPVRKEDSTVQRPGRRPGLPRKSLRSKI